MDDLDKKILEGLLDYCKKNEIRIAAFENELFIEIGFDYKGNYRCYEGIDIEISGDTKITDFK